MSNIIFPGEYIQIPSEVPGIEVYAPKPESEEDRVEIVDFDCPQCGANTAFNLSAGGIKCVHCGFFEPPEREILGRGAQDFEFKVETLVEAAHGWGTLRKDLLCSNCGASTSLPPGMLSSDCPFCGSNKVIQREGLQSGLRPRFLIPFQLDQEKCVSIAQEWVGSSWFVPSEVKRAASYEGFRPLYLPYWTFDAVASAKWQAQVGYDESQRYYDSGSKSWKTRTVTRWRQESGGTRHAYDDLLISGTQKISALHLEKIRDFELGELSAYAPEYLAGIAANAYDVPLETAWEKGRHAIRQDIYVKCHKQIRGDHVRAFEMALDLSEESWRYILLPVLVNAIRYRGNAYRIVVNGQTGAISGQRPVDWPKVWLTNSLMLLPGVLLGLVGFIMNLVFAEGIGFVWAGVGLLILGLVGMTILLRTAARLDDI